MDSKGEKGPKIIDFWGIFDEKWPKKVKKSAQKRSKSAKNAVFAPLSILRKMTRPPPLLEAGTPTFRTKNGTTPPPPGEK
jgi:hypothetical protein